MDNSPREPKPATARIAAIALGVVALVAVLVGVTTAAAQDSEPVVVTAAQTDDATTDGADAEEAVEEADADEEKHFDEDPAIEAAFEAFDACLVEQGLDLEALDDSDLDEGAIELSAEDEAAIDAAFEACDPILEEVEGIFFEGELEGCDYDEDGADQDADEAAALGS